MGYICQVILNDKKLFNNNRKGVVVIVLNSHKSSRKLVKSGILQECTFLLSIPTLYNIFYKEIKCRVSKFADDIERATPI